MGPICQLQQEFQFGINLEKSSSFVIEVNPIFFWESQIDDHLTRLRNAIRTSKKSLKLFIITIITVGGELSDRVCEFKLVESVRTQNNLIIMKSPCKIYACYK